MQQVNLAHEPDFAIGRLNVMPKSLEIGRDDGAREALEHRVMQVLIALAKARGEIVTRDELIASCWGGRIVGDDAINRVISRLRRAAEGIGDGSLRIETITKIGYRLVVVDGADGGLAEAPQGASGRLLTRRGVAAGLLIAGGGLGAGYLLTRGRGSAPSQEVETLMAQARQLMDQNSREGQYQAIGLYRRVVELAPDYADGWGWLGIAYAVPSHYRERPEGLMLGERAVSAGKRALQLDPRNVYGELALGIATPFIGHWRERDRRYFRAQANDPDNDQVLTFRAVNLQFAGRSAEAVPLYEKVRQRPLTPAVYNNYIRALWSAGRIEETDRKLADAAALYPTQGSIWNTRSRILMYSGRANAALALAEDVDGRPSSLDETDLADLRAMARAMLDRDPAQVDRLVADKMKVARRAATVAEYAIRDVSALGRIDDAFTLANAYYFGRGFIIPDYPTPGSAFSPDQRQTRLLFEPVTQAMRADPRFEKLIADLGLSAYWRESGVQPDYRRG